MVHSGGIQYYGEDASEKFAALMKDDPMVRTRSITVEVLDDKKMLELEVEGNFYRAEKLKLYSDGINLELGEGKILGSMRVTAEMDTEIPAEAAGKKANTKKVDLVDKLFTEIAPKYADRNGGYTRIVKIGQRKGDAAMEVLIELI